MEIVGIAKDIVHKISLLETGRDLLKGKAQEKADTIAEYEKKIAITLIKLKNGVEFEIEGNFIKNPQVTIMEKIAKGICYQEKLDMELAEAQYKNAVMGMHAIQAELNGYQSVFRHLEEKG